ncbi:MAG: hypothetical protein RLZ72_543 [Actinomycetota bacterium]|jgi:uncharacterized membrane-anchored protein
MLVKVPSITAFFWVIKILATTVGETFADYLNETLGLGLTGTSVVMGGALVVALAAQFITRRYRPSIYWTTIVLISVAGTLITDTLTDGMGVPLATSTAAFAILLTITFAAWFARERTLAMKSISTVSRETFYWFAILFTFALGTAVGDLLAENYGLGYGPALAMYGSLLALIVIAWKLKWVGEITAFWVAYVLTRPFGASLGDLLSQSPDDGGLGLGTTTTSMVFLAAIVGTVAYLAISRRDQIVNTSAK